MPRTTLILTAAALGLAACANVPDLRLRRTAPPPATTPEPMPLPPVDIEPGAVPSASAAEAACMAAGRERGFQVQGVVGSADVAGSDGQPASRDVMLRVARGAQIFDLRCNFHYASAQARVMAL
jgi:hypothetical protein